MGILIHDLITKAIQRIQIVCKHTGRLVDVCPFWFSEKGQAEIRALQVFSAISEPQRYDLAVALLTIGDLRHFYETLGDVITIENTRIWRETLNRFSHEMQSSTTPHAAPPTPIPAPAPVAPAARVEFPVHIPVDPRQPALFETPARAPIVAPVPVPEKPLAEDDATVVSQEPAPIPQAPVPNVVRAEATPLGFTLPNPNITDDDLYEIELAYNPSHLREVADRLGKRFGLKRFHIYRIWIARGKRQRMIVEDEEIEEILDQTPEHRGRIKEIARMTGYSDTAVSEVLRKQTIRRNPTAQPIAPDAITMPAPTTL